MMYQKFSMASEIFMRRTVRDGISTWTCWKTSRNFGTMNFMMARTTATAMVMTTAG